MYLEYISNMVRTLNQELYMKCFDNEQFSNSNVSWENVEVGSGFIDK